MKKKIFIQVVLILLIICFSYFLYKKYFFLDMADNKIVNDRSIKKDDNMNVINNLNYNSSDAEGRSYNIKAESGSMDILDNQVIKMNNVIANIGLEDGELMTITSDFAKYNTITYETKFISNVVSKYLDHNILSESLIIDFNKNILEASNEMTYKNSNTIMRADILKIDLLTKDIKISNYDNKVGSNIDRNKNVEIKFSNK